jgi:3-isopropylmalate dehydrogenase
LLEKYKIGLFGAITSKPKDKAKSELDPALQNQELVYYSPIVTMRQRFKMDICMRPCKTIKGNPLNFIRRTADGGF